jgi:Domain of unknown function (DUF4037)
MLGLEVAERYFWKHGAPLIEEKFRPYQQRIAAGLVGEGSECFGFDDEISRDHDWGPGFCVWLSEEDYRAIGPSLNAELTQLPGDFEGIVARKTSAWGAGRLGAFEIGAFYKKFIAFDRLPSNNRQWRLIPETNLATATNGKVFTDPLGEFTRFREGLKAFYPEDVRLKKIASRCMSIAQLGQYNFGRCVQREEWVAARIVEGQFCNNVISLVFLLNRHYTPFYKWMHRALKDLPVLGNVVHRLISDLVMSYGPEKKTRVIEDICATVVSGLRQNGLSDSTSDLLLDHGPRVQAKISDPELRNINVWVE